MKAVVVLALLVAGISAWPQSKGIHVPLFHRNGLASNIDFNNERLVTDAIAGVIQDISQGIKDAGLDPLDIDSLSAGYALPVPVLFGAELLIDKFLFTGLSNIVINRMSFSIITYRLTFEIELPHIALRLGDSKLDIVLFGSDYKASASGELDINRIKIVGNIRVSVGIISGISIRSVDMDFSLGGIRSDLNAVILGLDISHGLNKLLGNTIPNTLDEFSKEINELIEIIVEQVANSIL